MSTASLRRIAPSAVTFAALMSAGSAHAAAFSFNLNYDGTDHITSANASYTTGTFAAPTDSTLQAGFFFGFVVYPAGGAPCTTSYVGGVFNLGACVGAVVYQLGTTVLGPNQDTRVWMVAAGASQADLDAFGAAISSGLYYNYNELINTYQYEGVTGPMQGFDNPPLFVSSLSFDEPLPAPAPLVLLGTGLLGLVSTRRRTA